MRGGADLLGVDFDEHVAFVIAALDAQADELDLHGSGPRLASAARSRPAARRAVG